MTYENYELEGSFFYLVENDWLNAGSHNAPKEVVSGLSHNNLTLRWSGRICLVCEKSWYSSPSPLCRESRRSG